MNDDRRTKLLEGMRRALDLNTLVSALAVLQAMPGRCNRCGAAATQRCEDGTFGASASPDLACDACEPEYRAGLGNVGAVPTTEFSVLPTQGQHVRVLCGVVEELRPAAPR
jgi:hypothetical protein